MSVDAAVAAIEAGAAVVVPTDTVYGLVASPHEPGPAALVYRLKGRADETPTALLGRDLEALLDCIPELRGRPARIAAALFPGPYTLILPNPAGRFPWLTGGSPGPIGLRVPMLPEPGRAILDRVGVVLATSANLAGGPNPRRLEQVPEQIREGAAVLVDAGELPGVPSTVVDLTAAEARVLREGAVPAADALAAVSRALASA